MATGITYRINMKFALSESRAEFYLGYAERCKLGEANGCCYAPLLSLYFNNPDANPRDWRIMMVLPTKEKRDLFFEKYNRTFGYW